MAQKDLFNRYIWLVDLIYRKDGVTRDEINRQWSLSALNSDNESEIPERTFHRHKEAIKELFDIDIVCSRHGNNTYHIANRDTLKQDGLKGWVLNTFAINNIISESQDLKDRILLESIPSGQQFLIPIIEAMHDSKVIKISYQSFHVDMPKSHEVESYCLKIYKQRWYLLGRCGEINAMRTFALDRIKSIDVTGTTFDMPKFFDAKEYFEDCIGIIVEDNCKAQTVIIEARNGQQDYLRSLPLHATQTEIETEQSSAKFSLFVQPNYDLVQELLRYGDDVSVIQPKWFRERFRKIANAMSYNYNK